MDGKSGAVGEREQLFSFRFVKSFRRGVGLTRAEGDGGDGPILLALDPWAVLLEELGLLGERGQVRRARRWPLELGETDEVHV